MITNVDMVSLPSSLASIIMDIATNAQGSINHFISLLPNHLRIIYQPEGEWTWDDVFKTANSNGIYGFGLKNCQIYGKWNGAVTPAHDEMAASSSGNLLTS